MSKSVFNLKNLHRIQNLDEDFNDLLRQCVRDCRERPGLTQERRVEIKITCVPDQQDPEDCIVKVMTKCAIPTKKIDPYKMQATRNDGLKFQPDSPMAPDQDSFDFDDD